MANQQLPSLIHSYPSTPLPSPFQSPLLLLQIEKHKKINPKQTGQLVYDQKNGGFEQNQSFNSGLTVKGLILLKSTSYKTYLLHLISSTKTKFKLKCAPKVRNQQGNELNTLPTYFSSFNFVCLLFILFKLSSSMLKSGSPGSSESEPSQGTSRRALGSGLWTFIGRKCILKYALKRYQNSLSIASSIKLRFNVFEIF